MRHEQRNGLVNHLLLPYHSIFHWFRYALEGGLEGMRHLAPRHHGCSYSHRYFAPRACVAFQKEAAFPSAPRLFATTCVGLPSRKRWDPPRQLFSMAAMGDEALSVATGLSLSGVVFSMAARSVVAQIRRYSVRKGSSRRGLNWPGFASLYPQEMASPGEALRVHRGVMGRLGCRSA